MIELLPPGTAPHPGICLLCGAANRDMIIFDVTQDWNGAMLICVDCYKGVAIMFQDRLGIIDLKYLELLQVERDLLSGRLDNFGGALEVLKEGLNDSLGRFYKYLDSESGDLDGSDDVSSARVAEIITSTGTIGKQPEVNE